MPIDYAEEPGLSAADFLGLAQRVWPGEYATDAAQAALGRTDGHAEPRSLDECVVVARLVRGATLIR